MPACHTPAEKLRDLMNRILAREGGASIPIQCDSPNDASRLRLRLNKIRQADRRATELLMAKKGLAPGLLDQRSEYDRLLFSVTGAVLTIVKQEGPGESIFDRIIGEVPPPVQGKGQMTPAEREALEASLAKEPDFGDYDPLPHEEKAEPVADLDQPEVHDGASALTAKDLI